MIVDGIMMNGNPINLSAVHAEIVQTLSKDYPPHTEKEHRQDSTKGKNEPGKFTCASTSIVSAKNIQS